MATVRETPGLGFGDVMLVPKKSPVETRGDVDLTSQLVGDIWLWIPIVSANMDTVTEKEMAIEMALNGGVGVIHRFMPTDQMVDQIRAVKNKMRLEENRPLILNENATVQDALDLLAKQKRGVVVVYSGESFTGEMAGLATPKDLLFAQETGSLDMPISDVMTLRNELITVDTKASVSEALLTMRKARVEQVPRVAEDGKMISMISAKDAELRQKYPHATVDDQGRLVVGMAVGVKHREWEMERALAAEEVGADFLVVDIAHGHADHVVDMLGALKGSRLSIPVIAGNVATEEGAKELMDAGADAVKVGVGPGSVCETRIVTGFGVPQITAIMDAVLGVSSVVPIIADGGIRKSGDIVKALAAGADTVMMGGGLAGTDESPGDLMIRNGTRVKVVRGMASAGAMKSKNEIDGNSGSAPGEWKPVPEGKEDVVPYKGRVSEVLTEHAGGIHSGLSYGGGHTVKELQENAEFIIVTPAGAER